MTKFGFIVNNSTRGANEKIFMKRWGNIYRCDIDDVCIIYTPLRDFSDYGFFIFTKWGRTGNFTTSDRLIDFLNSRWEEVNPALTCLKFVVEK